MIGNATAGTVDYQTKSSSKSIIIRASSFEDAVRQTLGDCNYIPDGGGYFETLKSGNCWATPHTDGGGYSFGSFKGSQADIKYAWFPVSDPANDTPEQKAAREARRSDAKADAEDTKHAKHTAAAALAQHDFSLWDPSRPEDYYPAKKGIIPHLSRRDESGNTIVPKYFESELVSWVRITPDGKRNQTDGRANGAYLALGVEANAYTPEYVGGEIGFIGYEKLAPDIPIGVVEGYATLCSIFEATGRPVFCAFGCKNMAEVALIIRRLYPKNPIVIYADLGDDGAKYAMQAAQAQNIRRNGEIRYEVSGRVIYPNFGASYVEGDKTINDFNDLHRIKGIDEVREQLSLDVIKQLFDRPLQRTMKPVVIDNTNDKTQTVSSLLSSIFPIDLVNACRELGWSGSADAYPAQKHFKVALIQSIIKLAKKNNWHLMHDGKFYIYSGCRWIALEDAELKQLLLMASIRMGYPEIEARDAKFIDLLMSQSVQDGFFSDKKPVKPSTINLNNCTVHLELSGVSAKPFDHRDFATYQLDFDYDAAAKNELWLKTLEKLLPDPDTRKTLQQALGFIFVRGLKMERTTLIYGTGSNGKSLVYEVLNGVIGVENITNYSLESLTNETGYQRTMIKDALVNYGTDINLRKIDTAMLKTLASGEPIEARLPHGRPILMRDYAKLIFNVNNLDASFVENTHGFFRRLLIIPFLKTIADKDQDRDLHTKILKDKAGVLNWLIEGAEEVLKNRDIFVSRECHSFKASFVKDSDTAATFEDYLLELRGVGSFVATVQDAYDMYKQFCSDTGIRYALGRGTFTKRMLALGFNKVRKASGLVLEKFLTLEVA